MARCAFPHEALIPSGCLALQRRQPTGQDGVVKAAEAQRSSVQTWQWILISVCVCELRWRVTYSGNCAEGVAAIDHRCAVLADSSARDWVDLVLASMREGARSVLLKAADAVSPPSKEELDQLGLREAMLFAKPIRDAGERYMQDVLQSKPFLAVHCRRTDFLRAREATTPSVEAVAEQLELALADFGLEQVYVATDAPDDLREILRSQVRTGRIFFLEDLSDFGPAAAGSRLEGELAAIEMWIAARATAFIGTQESRFTMHIQTERSWLGKSFETSNREPCRKPFETWKGLREGLGAGKRQA
eukprot:s2517_g6.t1